MKCLCCGKELKFNNQFLWHESCINSFFGSKVIPDIKLSHELIENIALENSKLGVTVPGVQKKLSVNVISNSDGLRLTMVNYPSGFIFKPQVEKYPFLPESEHLLMNMAKLVKIPVVPNALIKYDGKLGYITKRIDRIKKGNEIKKIAMEDFCQLSERLTEDKYKSSYERCVDLIKKYSILQKADLVDFYIRIIFSFITGNNDMHLKNFSLIYDENFSGYRLSPQYDLVPSQIYLDDSEELALTLDGKKKNFTKKNFISFGKRCELNEKQCLKIFNKFASLEEKFINLVQESYLSDELKEKLIKLMRNRIERLS